jgi:hypothetical protein
MEYPPGNTKYTQKYCRSNPSLYDKHKAGLREVKGLSLTMIGSYITEPRYPQLEAFPELFVYGRFLPMKSSLSHITLNLANTLLLRSLLVKTINNHPFFLVLLAHCSKILHHRYFQMLKTALRKR